MSSSHSVVAAAATPTPTLNHDLKLVSAALFLAAVAVGLLVAWRFRRQVAGLVRAFFTEPGTAFNLAIFRIVFYSAMFPLIGLSDGTVQHYSSLPKDLVSVPAGFGPFYGALPISSTLVHVSYVVLIVSSVLATIGLLTRIASVAYLVSITYFLTIPNLFKVSHDHIIVWVALILALSRTADVWSIDSVIRARRDARLGRALAPNDSRRYSRPLRLTWLFLALTYVGPGLWKFRDTGLEWASASNMRAIIYDKWYELDGWRPFVPIDKSGLLLTAGGLMTLAFELSFPLLIWHRFTRPIAAVGGIFFHTMTAVVMDIYFWSQVALYVSFVDWYRISLAFFARRRRPLVLCYDDTCGVCRASAASLARVVLPGGIEFVPAQEAAQSTVPIEPDLAELRREIHLFTPADTLRGFAVYRRLAWRIPVLWPLLPFFYLPPVESVGRRVYARVSVHRACGSTPVAAAPEAPPGLRAWGGGVWVLAPTAAAAVILALGVDAVQKEEVHGWPIALYPTFAGLWAPETQQLIIVESRTDGTRASVTLQPCFPWMTSDRYANVVNTAVSRARAGRPAALRSLLGAALPGCPSLEKKVTSLSFYDKTVATTPSVAGRVLSKRLLLEERLAS